MKAAKRTTLKKKTILGIILAFAIVGLASVLLFYKGVVDLTRSEHIVHSSDLANTVASSLDNEQVKAVRDEVVEIYRRLPRADCMLSDQADEDGYDEYLSHYSHVMDMEEFVSLRDALRRTQDGAHVDSLYLMYPDLVSGNLVYLVDAAYEDIWYPGTLEELYESDFSVHGDVYSGFDALASVNKDGENIITTAVPLIDDEGKLIAYVGIDYVVDDLLESQHKLIYMQIGLVALLAAITAYVVIKLVDRQIVQPINALSEAAVHFNDSDKSHNMNRFADLKIRTGDEIQTLAESMSKMETDISSYVASLLSARSDLASTRNELKESKEYAEEMERNANIDALTGLRNKRSYETATAELNKDISDKTARFGIVVADLNNLKTINDSYGHEYGDEALVAVSSVLTDVFKFSPVYRYGGDEFAVILSRHDLSNIDDLIAEFHALLKKRKDDSTARPWLKEEAAVGYAVYDHDIDKDIDSVFKRADKAMYEDKMRLKAAENKT